MQALRSYRKRLCSEILLPHNGLIGLDPIYSIDQTCGCTKVGFRVKIELIYEVLREFGLGDDVCERPLCDPTPHEVILIRAWQV